MQTNLFSSDPLSVLGFASETPSSSVNANSTSASSNSPSGTQNGDSISGQATDLFSNLLFSSLTSGDLASGEKRDTANVLPTLNNSPMDAISSMQSTLLLGLQSSLLSTSLLSEPSENIVATNEQNEGTSTSSNLALFSQNNLSLQDGFDTVNILNHIPIVSDIYQTTSENAPIGMAAKLAGSFLFYGTTGLAYSAAELAYQSFTGTSISKTITDTAMNFDYGSIFGDALQANGQQPSEYLTASPKNIAEKETNAQKIYKYRNDIQTSKFPPAQLTNTLTSS